MWAGWVDLAMQRLAQGDSHGAWTAAFIANDGDGAPCPFADPLLVDGWNYADKARQTVAARRSRQQPWRPRAGSTQAAHSAEHIRDFDL